MKRFLPVLVQRRLQPEGVRATGISAFGHASHIWQCGMIAAETLLEPKFLLSVTATECLLLGKDYRDLLGWEIREKVAHKAFINIENVVATATLNQRIDLNSIVRLFPGVEYRPQLFPGLVYRLKKPKTATLIFSSGKMVCTGAKSERQARKAVTKVVDELKRGGIVILGKPEIQVQNIVASAGLGGRIDLEKTTYSLKRTMYEPEQFPGLIYRMDDPKVVILIFASGKLVCTGAKKEAEVLEPSQNCRKRSKKRNS